MDQKKVWNNLAKEWYELKNNPIKRVIKFLESQQGKILDLGSGAGRHLIKIKNAKMYLIDFSENMIKFAKQKAKKQNINAEFFVSQIHKLPFKDNFFNSAICTSSLHCIQGKSKRAEVIKELFRVLKPKAQAMISVWSRNNQRIKNKPKSGFIPWTVDGKKYQRYTYIYEKQELENQLEKIGFKIIKSKEDNNIILIAEKP